MNNFETLKPYLRFGEKDDFLFIQIIKRRKENPTMTLGVERLKSYSCYSLEELEKLMPRIIEICDTNNARAYIRLNGQNAVDVSLRAIELISKNIRNGIPRKNRKIWDSVAGKAGKNDFWILDVDKEHIESNPHVIRELYSILSDYFLNTRKLNTYILGFIPTVSGKHVIVQSFDTSLLVKFNKQFSNNGISVIQIQKDANTILYCP